MPDLSKKSTDLVPVNVLVPESFSCVLMMVFPAVHPPELSSSTNTSQPPSQLPATQLVPVFEVQTPAPVLRLMASERATFRSAEKSLIWAANLLRERNVPKLGAAIARRIPATVKVITNSTSVKPLIPTNGCFLPTNGITTGVIIPMNGIKRQIKGNTFCLP